MQIKSKIKYLILAAVLIYLISPQPAFAFVFDYFDAALGGVEEAVGPIIRWEVTVMLFHMGVLILVGLSAWALETATEHPEWLSVMNNDMVRAGWDFTAGIANLFIVLALIVIAFGFILKIESLQAKKALPRLIIVALLVNFSLVFVGALVDIANIIFNTILNSAGPGLPSRIVDQLGTNSYNIIFELGFTLAALAAAGLVPFIAPFAQFGKILLLGAGILYLPSMANWIITGLLGMMMAGIFFLYAFLFAARVYIIQLLAMVSPIFFLCWALPPLKKYWDEWFGHLMEWLFFGVILFFFLVIGLKGAEVLMPKDALSKAQIPILSAFNLDTFFSSVLPYYFFLFIYLVVVGAWVTMRVMPQIAKVLVEQGKQVGGQLWAMGAKPFGKAVGQEITKAAAKIEEKEKAGEKIGRLEKIIARPTGWAYHVAGTSTMEEHKKRIAGEAQEFAKIQDRNLALQKIRDAEPEKAALFTAMMIDKGGESKKAVLGATTSEQAIQRAKAAMSAESPETAKIITRSYFSELSEEHLRDFGFKDETGSDMWETKGYKSIKDWVWGETDPSEIGHFKEDFYKTDEMKDRIARVGSPGQVAALAQKHRQIFTKPQQEYLKRAYSTVDDYRKVNKEQADFFESNLGAPLGLGNPWEGVKPTAGAGVSPEGPGETEEDKRIWEEISRKKGEEEGSSAAVSTGRRPPGGRGLGGGGEGMGEGMGEGTKEGVIRGAGPRLKKEVPKKPEEELRGQGKPQETRGDWMYEYYRTEANTEVNKQLESIKRGKEEDGQVHPALIEDVINYIKDNADKLGIDRKQINLSQDQINEFASKEKDLTTFVHDLLERAKK